MIRSSKSFKCIYDRGFWNESDCSKGLDLQGKDFIIDVATIEAMLFDPTYVSLAKVKITGINFQLAIPTKNYDD